MGSLGGCDHDRVEAIIGPMLTAPVADASPAGKGYIAAVMADQGAAFPVG